MNLRLYARGPSTDPETPSPGAVRLIRFSGASRTRESYCGGLSVGRLRAALMERHGITSRDLEPAVQAISLPARSPNIFDHMGGQ